MRKATMQAVFWLDPLNRTGRARDKNSGVLASSPIESWSEVLSRFDGEDPTILQPTVFNWLSGSPRDGSDPVRFRPTLTSGASVRFSGSLGDPQQVATGNMQNVVPKDRASGDPLVADLSNVVGGSAMPGHLLANTTPGKESRCTVLRSTGTPGQFVLTQPMSISSDWPNTGDPVEVDTYANGDTFNLYIRDAVDFVHVEPIVADFDFNNTQFTVIERLAVMATPGSTGPEAVYVGDALAMIDHLSDRRIVTTRPANGKNTLLFNGMHNGGIVGGDVTIDGVGNGLWMFGGATVGLGLVGGKVDLDAIMLVRARMTGTQLGAVFLDQGVTMTVDGQSVLSPVELALAATWGPGALDAVGRLVLGQPAASSLLHLGGTTINGQTKVFAATRTTPSTIDGSAALSPAAIDASETGMWIPGGGAIAPF